MRAMPEKSPETGWPQGIHGSIKRELQNACSRLPRAWRHGPGSRRRDENPGPRVGRLPHPDFRSRNGITTKHNRQDENAGGALADTNFPIG